MCIHRNNFKSWVLLDKCNSSIPPPYLLKFTELVSYLKTVHAQRSVSNYIIYIVGVHRFDDSFGIRGLCLLLIMLDNCKLNS